MRVKYCLELFFLNLDFGGEVVLLAEVDMRVFRGAIWLKSILTLSVANGQWGVMFSSLRLMFY